MGMQEVKQMIEFSRLQYSRLKSRVKKLESLKSYTKPLEAMQELDEKVYQAVNNFE